MNSRALAVLLAVCMLVVGCRNAPRTDALRQSARSLEQNELDQAISLANESLEKQPKGPNAAYALYIRGRAYEQRVATSMPQMLTNLQLARASYIEAMRHNPPKQLLTYIRASLGKVAFYQDDFQTAVQQLWLAYNELTEPELKSATLYHLGKAQQRSGQFSQADSTFSSVIQRYPDTGWAQKAGEVRGAKAFYLQLAVYERPESVEPAAKVVQQRGLNPVRLKDDQNRFILRAGPFNSYAQAKQLRPKLADTFPDATIVP